MHTPCPRINRARKRLGVTHCNIGPLHQGRPPEKSRHPFSNKLTVSPQSWPPSPISNTATPRSCSSSLPGPSHIHHGGNHATLTPILFPGACPSTINPNNVTSVLHSEPALTCEAACPRQQSTWAVTWTGHPVSELAWPRQPGGRAWREIRKTKRECFLYGCCTNPM